MNVRAKKVTGAALTREEYDALLARIEDLEDALRLIESKREHGKRELVPDELVGRLLAGEHPVKVWREHRGLTLARLAAASGVGTSYISEIESGKKPGSVAAMKKLAAALKLELDDLIR